MEEKSKLAISFAVKAHAGKKRRCSQDIPAIFHSLAVGKLLEEYGFDDNVVAAGILHDVVEDTSYGETDLKILFGSDVTNMVMMATDLDPAKSWHERKQDKINHVKSLFQRQLAIICADKIVNIEELKRYFEKIGKHDFSSFHALEKEQYWYYQTIYDELVKYFDHSLMLKRLKENIDQVFQNNLNSTSIQSAIYYQSSEEYNHLRALHAKKEELYALRKLCSSGNKSPLIVEFGGTPNQEVDGLLRGFETYFKMGGFDVRTVKNITSMPSYLEHLEDIEDIELVLPFNQIYDLNEMMVHQLEEVKKDQPDIILLEHYFTESLIQLTRFWQRKRICDSEYQLCLEAILPHMVSQLDFVVAFSVASEMVMQEFYQTNFTLEKSGGPSITYLNDYNQAFIDATSFLASVPSTILFPDCFHSRKATLKIVDEVMDGLRAKQIELVKRDYQIK